MLKIIFIFRIWTPNLHPCVFGMWWLDLLSKAQRPPDILWYGTYYSIVRVLPTVQVAANETYIPFAILCLERRENAFFVEKVVT